jgi:intein/homing endonuclease
MSDTNLAFTTNDPYILGLMGTNTYTKFIPDCIKYANKNYRVALLQGLMDSDGYVNSGGKDIHYTTVNNRLASDVQEVARSLGIKCRILKTVVKGKEYNRVKMSGNIEFDLFRLPRKLDRFKLRKTKKTFENVNLISIKKLDYKEESSCILVDNPNHLYITKDFIVTHNSILHTAKLLNFIWFENDKKCKMFASDAAFLDSTNGS